jgi:hypothetical protein
MSFGIPSLGPAFLGHQLHGRPLMAGDRVAAMPFPKRLLVHPDVRNRLRDFPAATRDRTAHHTPRLIPGDLRDAARADDLLHGLNPSDDRPLHQQRESTAGLGPRPWRTPWVGTRRARYPSVEKRLVLTRVEVSPHSLVGVDRDPAAPRVHPGRTRKARREELRKLGDAGPDIA